MRHQIFAIIKINFYNKKSHFKGNSNNADSNIFSYRFDIKKTVFVLSFSL